MFSRKNKKKLSLADRLPGIRTWFDTAYGRLLLEGEQQAVAHALENYRGKRIVQLSSLPNVVKHNQSVFRQVWRVQCCATDAVEPVSVISEFEYLPFEDESVDIVIVHHGLEFSPKAQQFLKEIERITRCGGHVIVVAFNPISLNGLYTSFMRLVTNNSVWNRKRLSIHRLKDWLKFLDFSLLELHHLLHDFPINNVSYLKCTTKLFSLFAKLNMPFGASYCAIARKDKLGMHKPKPIWQADVIKRALSVPRPVQSIHSANRDDAPKP